MSTTSTSSSTPSTEASAVVDLTDDESGALVNHDYVALSEMGAHFLSLTLFIAVYAEIWTRDRGPLAFQRDFAARVQHWLGGPYPSIAT